MGAPGSILATCNCTTVNSSLPMKYHGSPMPGIDAATNARKRSAATILLGGLHLAANALGFAKNTKQVTAQNFADIGGVIITVQERLRDLWQVRGRIDAFGSCAADSIKI